MEEALSVGGWAWVCLIGAQEDIVRVILTTSIRVTSHEVSFTEQEKVDIVGM